jgi:hypothetical protein
MAPTPDRSPASSARVNGVAGIQGPAAGPSMDLGLGVVLARRAIEARFRRAGVAKW